MTKANAHVLNINRLLKKVKSDIYMDFIRSDNKELLITTNKVAVVFNLNIIKKYMKDSNDMDYSDIMSLRLSQSKSYLKIFSISYIVKDNNLPIFSNIVETIIKSMYIFDNIVLTFKPCIIKVLSKSDIAVIWIDIQSSQSSLNVKMIINKYFNIGSHIATIHSTNMNFSVPQCKNCQKW